METEAQRSLSLRASRRTERGDWGTRRKGDETDVSATGSGLHDPLRMVWRKGFIRLVLVSAILWMLLILFALLFHLWSCHSSISFFSALCNQDSKVFVILDTMGLTSKPQHRCGIPLVDDPDAIVIPKRTPDTIPKNLTYVLEDEQENADEKSQALFGGHQNWTQRENSFKLNTTMKVHCGFIKSGGGEMEAEDVKYAKKCRFVVASGIFDGKMFLLERPVMEENGLFPQAQYSIWIDGKMELIVDPLLIVERYLWRGKHTFAIACHKHHRSIYEEADAIKR
ncbi:hypothetical protein OPV22_021233 [Ensete ventricosum]|uniref:TOD1/MUCI70 glycosyltransferase-like domain-containing protein n=1 Tax=Ensete ventricosum TaxID=4639 RepID=A0AAV8QGE6_ENSVE|nr:hypothetical protein OPV22_021233 [Ensete ventricosum]